MARLFNVLECLAANLKTSERPSRKAVRCLVGLAEYGSFNQKTDVALENESKLNEMDLK